jgi:hypothetical protein
VDLGRAVTPPQDIESTARQRGTDKSKGKMAELRKLFDGSEELVSITILPWYMRQVFLP